MAKKYDRHHLLWYRSEWNTGYAHALRNHWYFVTDIPRNTLHASIHVQLQKIPVPSGANAKSAYEQVVALERYGALRKDDNLQKRLGLLIALFECVEPATTEALKKQLDIVRKYEKASG